MEINYEHLEPLLAKLTYMSEDDLEQVRRAYAIAYEGHDGQMRSSGLPYITHPVAVAGILADMKLDLPSIQAAILHDTIEDTKFTREDLVNFFGENVAVIVDGVSKLDKLKFRTRQEAEVANFRKMILAMTKDVRVVLIKLADRTHNMRTLGALRLDKQRRIAQETLDIYSALAYRLGIMHIKRELDDLAFKVIFPLRHKLLFKAREVNVLRNHAVLTDIKEAINKKLEQFKINAQVVIEEKSLLFLYRRMMKTHQKFNSILDAYRFIIKTTSLDDSYRALGIVHNLFRPVPGSFKDFIAIPKANGYQSLHTETINNSGQQVEVFIRTEAMDEIAELGIASTLVYNENDKKNTIGEIRINAWLNALSELQHTTVNSIEFNNSVKEEIFPEDIFVFTPRGKIIELPNNSTVLDFAFYIHTDIGIHAKSALVDGIDAPLDQILKSGQTVKVVTDELVFPTEESLSAVHSSRAKARIRDVLKSQEMESYICTGKDVLEKSLKTSINNIAPNIINKALEFFNLKSLNDLFAEICFGNIISPVAKAVIESYSDNADKELSNILVELQKGKLCSDLTYQYFIEHGYNIEVDPSSFITVGDDILVTANFGKGLLVHHISTPVIAQKNLTPYQHIRIKWGLEQLPRSLVRVVFVFDKANKTSEIVDTLLETVNQYRTNVLRSLFDVEEQLHYCQITLDLMVSNVSDLDNLVSFIKEQTKLQLLTYNRIYCNSEI